jgi:hypothetical protein
MRGGLLVVMIAGILAAPGVAAEVDPVRRAAAAEPALYGKVLFSDDSPALVEDANTFVWLTSATGDLHLGQVQEDGCFEVHLLKAEIEQIASEQTRLAVAVPGCTREDFPVDLLARDKAKAGILKVPRPAAAGQVNLQPGSLSLVGRPLPDFAGAEPAFDPNHAKGQRVLVCLWDMNQRPSRRIVEELVKRAGTLKAAAVQAALVQTSMLDPNEVSSWLKDRSVSFPCCTAQLDEQRLKRTWAFDALPWLILTDPNHKVAAEGFSLDRLDAGLKVGDLGTLAGRPSSTGIPPTPRQAQDPNWQTVFNQIYRLDTDQVLKRIAPPFIPQRNDFYASKRSGSPMPCLLLEWDGRLGKWQESSGPLDLRYVLSLVVGLRNYQFEGPEDLLTLRLPGDWIVRSNTATKDRGKALERILGDAGRKIVFEPRTRERDVRIVATGRFAFSPLEATDEDALLHVYSDFQDGQQPVFGIRTARSAYQILDIVSEFTGLRVIDKIDGVPGVNLRCACHNSGRVDWIRDPEEKGQKLQMLLDNLTKQTALHFKVEREPVEVWFVMEGKP